MSAAGLGLGALAPEELAAGPIGWAILGVTVLVVAAASIMNASNSADEEHADAEPTDTKECPEKPATPEDIAAEGTPDPDRPTLKDGGQQIIKSGDMNEANEDFDRLDPSNVTDQGDGVRTGDLSDGRKAIVRPNSEPTLEIQSDGVPDYKIRYRQ